jgi:hypothetical protein
VRHLAERRAAAALEADELAYRADRQNRLEQRGDSRGVYGVAGAELMRDLTPEPPVVPLDAPPGRSHDRRGGQDACRAGSATRR